MPPNRDSAKAGFGLAWRGLAERDSLLGILSLFAGICQAQGSWNQIVVRAGKGDKDRVTMLPESLKEELKAHLHRVRELHERDVRAGFGEVWLPKAVGVKYLRAAREWIWQWIFPSAEVSVDPVGGARRRHHVSDAGVQRALKSA